jgi:hypothetical protein
MVVACSFFSLILGLFIWFDTLQTRKNLSIIWSEQPMAVQSLLQQRVSDVFIRGSKADRDSSNAVATSTR